MSPYGRLNGCTPFQSAIVGTIIYRAVTASRNRYRNVNPTISWV